MKQTLTFKSQKGLDLSGILHLPDTIKPKAFGIFAHCFTCSKDIHAAVNIAKQLAAEGYGILRFDFAGIGASQGEFDNTNFSSNIDDLISAFQYLKTHYEAPQFLIGHSLGGTAALAAAPKLSEVKAVATIGSPASPDHVLHVLDGYLERLEQTGEAIVPVAGRDMKFRQSFVDDVMRHVSDYSHLGKALMVMHAPFDTIVSINEASKIFTQARHPKSFISLNKADHLLSRKDDASYAANIIAGWLPNYVDIQQEAANTIETGVVVKGETDRIYLNIAQAGQHRFIVDEPLSYGGSDLGPTPYQYLGVALGSCTSMTLNGYSRRKELAVKSVLVHITHDRVHAKDCKTCEKTEGKVDRFTRHITIDGDVTEEQRERLLQIADLCPVHKTLENEIKIETVLKPTA